MTVSDTLVQYIQDRTNETITDPDINLFENGFLTSLDVLDMISFIEKTFCIEVLAESVDMESFGSIRGMVNLVEKNKA